MPVSPWDASSLSYVLTEETISPIFRVEFLSTAYNVPAWDIQVTLDGGRCPYATATFKAGPEWMADPTLTSGAYRATSPFYASQVVQIFAGYRHLIGGVMTDDLQPLFVGQVTKRELVESSNGTTYVQFTCESCENHWDFPSSRSHSVTDTYTRVKQTCDLINASAQPWFHDAIIYEEPSQLNTPTSAQLAAFRGLYLQIGDSVLDFITAMASALGQWVRGDHRTVNTTPRLVISADPYPYRSATSLTRSAFSELRRVEDVGQWANVLDLTCSWTDNSTGEQKTKKKTYTSPSDLVAYPYKIRTRAVTVNTYPPSGALPANYPLAVVWLRRIGAMKEVQYSGTSRAMFWLQPRIDGVALTDNVYGDTAGPLDSVTFNVDQGTQTMTWSAENTNNGV